MKIGNIYKELLKTPNSIAIYKKLYQYYKEMNMIDEANAFANLLITRFQEVIIEKEINNNTTDQ